MLMADLRTNKIDAARRQTDASIRLHFGGEDPFAIHTIASAVHRILRDIAEKQANCDWHEAIKKNIRPGMENKFWAAMNTEANFLKHADKDHDGILEVGEEINDHMILGCCLYYQSLGYEPTPEMRGFVAWYIMIYPELLVDEAPAKSLLTGKDFDRWRQLPRDKSLAYGNELIALAKRQALHI